MIATLANMRQVYREGVFAYSPDTGEECSANPGDYWYLLDDEALIDAFDEPMVLVTRAPMIEEIR